MISISSKKSLCIWSDHNDYHYNFFKIHLQLISHIWFALLKVNHPLPLQKDEEIASWSILFNVRKRESNPATINSDKRVEIALFQRL